MEVKVGSGAQSCILPLKVYHKMLPENLSNDDLPKTLHKHELLKSQADRVPQVHATGKIKFAHYRTDNWMPIHFFIMDIKN